MSKIVVRTTGDKIKIKLVEEAPAEGISAGAQPAEPSLQASEKNKIKFTRPIINLMENRTESAFRPNEDDIELVYALSGSNPDTPDKLHKLSSQRVVEEATQNHILSSVKESIEYLLKERGDIPKLVILLHTHPHGTPQPSSDDKRYFLSSLETIKRLVPGANIVFGIHAISSELIRERKDPVVLLKMAIKWSSIIKEHEIILYSPNAKPYEVEIIE